MNPVPFASSVKPNMLRYGARVLIAAGGSGGHIFPAVALARKLKEVRPDIDILFVGSNKSLDKSIFEKEGFRYSLLSANKLPYRITPKIIFFLIKLKFDCLKSLLLVAAYRPDAMVGFGGYVSSVVSLASFIFRVPIAAHEQNVVPGRANKFLFRWAAKIAVSFKETERFTGEHASKVVITGNPIRATICSATGAKCDKPASLKKFGFVPDKFTILLIGGSQGAHFLNKKFVDAIIGMDEKIKASLQIVHITGIKDYGWVVKEYEKSSLEARAYSFIDRIEDAYTVSDLVITRSGASALFEIALFEKPMILVPYPFAMSHQAENARVFSVRGAAIEIDEKYLSAELFKNKILSLMNDRVMLNGLAARARELSVPEAADNLSKLVLELSRR